MRILLDARTVGRAFSGVGFYVLELVRAFAASRVEHEFRLLVHGDGALRDLTLDARFRLVEAPFSPESHPFGDLWEEFALPRLAGNLGCDILHGPAFLIPLRRTRVAKVVTVHDLVAFTHPETIPAKYAFYMRELIRRATRSADRIITVSESVRRELLERFPISPERITAIHHGVAARFTPARAPAVEAVRARHGLGRPYLLFVGNLEPRKNLVGLVEAFRRLRALGAGHVDLAVAGQIAWKSGPLVEALRAPDVREAVKLLGYVDADDLPALYSGAEAFVFPSHWEGFGMPVLEAMACGAPVVASRIASIEEVAGDAAILVDPRKPDSIAEGVARALGESRESHSNAGRARAALFSWEATAAHTLDAYAAARANPS